jgi:trk system potassium uptake protein TrkA
MDVLICGVGKVARHLLNRMGDTWRVTLTDKLAERIDGLQAEFPIVQRVLAADASSPVTLDDLGVGDYDYVLALTDNDRANFAIVNHAEARGVNHNLALVNDNKNLPMFAETGARIVLGSTLLAENIYHYLEDPRIRVAPLTMGHADVMEIDASHHLRMIGRPVSALTYADWRVVAIFRGDELIFPRGSTVIEDQDRLVILGKPGIFKPVCDLLECGSPHFPLAYGHGLLLALAPGTDHSQMIRESMHLAQNTKVEHLTVFCSKSQCDIESELDEWRQSTEVSVVPVEGDLPARVSEIADRENYGLVVIDPFKPSFFRLFAKPALISFAHSLPCPLLVARHSFPYKRILVPFSGSPMAEQALEVAIDLAKQLESTVATAVVEEPEFIKGHEEEDQAGFISKRISEIAHILKIEVEQIALKGNPVKEIAEIAKNFDLMIIGSTSKDKGLFMPHVGELMAREAPCSVLIVAG